MFAGPRLSALLDDALKSFVAQVPGLRDGSDSAIHDARVAIRRLREAAALARVDFEEATFDDLERRLGRMFKVLGRARNADSAQNLVQHSHFMTRSSPNHNACHCPVVSRP